MPSRSHRIALAIAVIGAALLVVHVALGAAAMMTYSQWTSGAVIGSVLLVVGIVGALRTR